VYESLEEIPEVRGKAGLALECSGREEGVYAAMSYLRKGGELFLIGVPWYRSTDTYAQSFLLNIFYGYIHVYSGWEWALPHNSREFEPNSSNGNFAKAIDWIQEGFIKVEGIYQIESPFNCTNVYEQIANRELDKTCVIFDWRNFRRRDNTVAEAIKS
jgi:threonine dehydrogenase-like Zn-dependent dehydrogenase